VLPDIEMDPQHDVLSALVQWVEKGSAPEKLFTLTMTRSTARARFAPIRRVPTGTAGTAAMMQGTSTVLKPTSWRAASQ
jgi:hypothetical protein